MNWLLWRCALDERIRADIHTVRSVWTFADWLDATIVLDTIEHVTPRDGGPDGDADREA